MILLLKIDVKNGAWHCLVTSNAWIWIFSHKGTKEHKDHKVFVWYLLCYL